MNNYEISPHKIAIPHDDIPTQPGIGKRHVTSDENPAFKTLVSTVREHGVLNPIPIRNVNGEFILAVPSRYYGLMAAREGNVKKVPVEVIEDG